MVVFVSKPEKMLSVQARYFASRLVGHIKPISGKLVGEIANCSCDNYCHDCTDQLLLQKRRHCCSTSLDFRVVYNDVHVFLGEEVCISLVVNKKSMGVGTLGARGHVPPTSQNCM